MLKQALGMADQDLKIIVKIISSAITHSIERFYYYGSICEEEGEGWFLTGEIIVCSLKYH